MINGNVFFAYIYKLKKENKNGSMTVSDVSSRIVAGMKKPTGCNRMCLQLTPNKPNKSLKSKLEIF